MTGSPINFWYWLAQSWFFQIFNPHKILIVCFIQVSLVKIWVSRRFFSHKLCYYCVYWSETSLLNQILHNLILSLLTFTSFIWNINLRITVEAKETFSFVVFITKPLLSCLVAIWETEYYRTRVLSNRCKFIDLLIYESTVVFTPPKGVNTLVIIYLRRKRVVV